MNIKDPKIDVNLPRGKTLSDKWILEELEKVIYIVNESFKNYQFSLAGENLRDFTWNELADWYLEVAKVEKSKSEILNYLLNSILRLWHPFMPFVTEAIWQEIYGKENKRLLITEEFPKDKGYKKYNKFIDFSLIKDIIISIRNVRAQYKIKPSARINAIIYGGDNTNLIKTHIELIKKLRTGVGELEVKKSGQKVSNAIYITVNGIEIYLIIPNFNFKAEIKRLKEEILDQEKRIKSQREKLTNKEFITKAPTNIVNQEKDKLEAWKRELNKLKAQLYSFK